MTDHESRLDWLAAHWRVVLGVFAGLLVGAVVGWILGSYTACRDSGCKIRVDSVEAIGTWVGGLGTIAAVLAAVVAFRSEEAARREQEARLMRTRAEQVELDQQLAAQMVLFARIRMLRGRAREANSRQILNFDVGVTNETNTTSAYKVRLITPYGRGWRPKLAPAESEAVNVRVDPDVSNMPEPQDRTAWEAETIADVSVEYEMNGNRWKRQGTEPPELLGPALP